jgi:hypothetical protein
LPSVGAAITVLDTKGLLLLQDKTFPNLVRIVTGESLTGSWWGHHLGHQIFRAANEVADHPDVLVCKLLGGKVTFVNRRLWPEVLAVAVSCEPWQMAGLSAGGRRLFDDVERMGSVVASGPLSRELERRLLVHGDQVHTESGTHQARLETWQAWAQRSGCNPHGSAVEAKASLEVAVLDLGGSVAILPWHRFGSAPAKNRKSSNR